jgi:hypothetical protein
VEEIPSATGSQWGISMTAGDIYTVAGSDTGGSGASGPAPIAAAAVVASPFLLLRNVRLAGDYAALEVAGDTGRASCDLTGITDEIAAEARGQLLAEQEAAARGKPMHLRNAATASSQHRTRTTRTSRSGFTHRSSRRTR